jgi:hypothetical protein
MGTFDDALKNAVPGGNLTTPIAVAVGALLLGKLFSGNSSAPAAGPAPAAPAAQGGGLLGGLSDLVQKFQNSGQAATAGTTDHQRFGSPVRHERRGVAWAIGQGPTEHCEQPHAKWPFADVDRTRALIACDRTASGYDLAAALQWQGEKDGGRGSPIPLATPE